MNTLNKFKVSARHLPGQKLPLLYYCETLIGCASAYNQLSQEESLQCIQCAVENGMTAYNTYLILLTVWVCNLKICFQVLFTGSLKDW